MGRSLAMGRSPTLRGRPAANIVSEEEEVVDEAEGAAATDEDVAEAEGAAATDADVAEAEGAAAVDADVAATDDDDEVKEALAVNELIGGVEGVAVDELICAVDELIGGDDVELFFDSTSDDRSLENHGQNRKSFICCH